MVASLSQHHQDAIHSPDAFVLNASAPMPTCHTVFFHVPENEVTALMDDIAAELLSVARRHVELKIKLHVYALSALSEGCAHYLVWQISRGNINSIVQQLLLALLRIYLSAEESYITLKYTVAVALASSAAAAESRCSQIGDAEDDVISRDRSSVQLFQQYIHQGAKKSSKRIETYSQLFFFGVVGILPLLPFDSLNQDDIDLLSRDCRPPIRDGLYTTLVEIKGLSERLYWGRHAARSVFRCLKLAPSIGTPLGAENTIASCLKIFLHGPFDKGDHAVDSETVSGICCAKSKELWDYGLNLLGITIVDPLCDVVLESLALHSLPGHLFEISVSANPFTSPLAMRRLWELIQLILASTNFTPNQRLHSLDSLLQRDEFVEVKRSFGGYGLPSSIDDFQLEPIWFEQLEPMISLGPVLEIDGGIIQVMMAYYSGDVSPEGAPVSVSRVEVLNKWQRLDAMYRARKRALERWANVRRTLGTTNAFSCGLVGAYLESFVSSR